MQDINIATIMCYSIIYTIDSRGLLRISVSLTICGALHFDEIRELYIIIIRASVDALYRDGANVRGDAHTLKASMLREYVNMSLLRHLVKLYKAY